MTAKTRGKGPLPVTESVYLREGLFEKAGDEDVLRATRCKGCGRTHFPPVAICLDCLGADLEPTRLPKTGTLFSYTVMHLPSANFPPGHMVGYVLIEPGVRVFAPLNYPPERQPQVGDKMALEIAPLWHDETRGDVVAYRFRPEPIAGAGHA